MKNYKIINYLLLLCMLMFVGCAEVPPRHEGFKNRKLKGGIDSTSVVGEGKYYVPPYTDYIVYDIGEITTEIESEDVQDKNGLNIDVTLFVVTQIEKGKSWKLEKQVGKNYITSKIIPFSTSATRNVVGKYTAKQLYSDKRSALELEIAEILKPQLGNMNINLIDVLISDIDLPESLEKQLEEKERQKERNLTAQQVKAEKKALAEAAIEVARGDSLSNVIRSAGLAKKIEAIDEAMANSKHYIEYMEVQARLEHEKKWNGSYGEGNVFGTGSQGIILQRKN